MSIDSNIVYTRLVVFLIKSKGYNCNICELFTQSEEFKMLLNFQNYIDVNVIVRVEVKETDIYGFDYKRYSDKKVKDSNYKKSSRTVDIYTRNFALAKHFKITHYPAIVLEIKKKSQPAEFRVLQGVKFAQKNSKDHIVRYNFIKYLLAYLKGIMPDPDQIAAFTHNKYKYVMQKNPKLIKITD